MVDLDELLRLANTAKLPFQIYKVCHLDDHHDEIIDADRFYVKYLNSEQDEYILAACNAVPELITRIKELEEKLETIKRKSDD